MMKLVSLTWLILITILSHTPGDKSSEESRWLSKLILVDEGLLRKSAHVVCFTVLMAFSLCGWGKWAGICVLAWSVIDEYSKPLVTGRHADVRDWLLNVAGCILGYGVWFFL